MSISNMVLLEFEFFSNFEKPIPSLYNYNVLTTILYTRPIFYGMYTLWIFYYYITKIQRIYMYILQNFVFKGVVATYNSYDNVLMYCGTNII